jgi:NADPH:quinone reductase-like Zn-dependent oxidoreductase
MGEAPLKWMAKKPAVPESDVAGVVEGGDLSGTDFKVGDAVFGIVPAPSMYVPLPLLTLWT